MTLRTRLRNWQIRLGLGKTTNDPSGPSHEDLAREASSTASREANTSREGAS